MGALTTVRVCRCVDLIGFHTFDYARHFLSSVKRCVAAAALAVACRLLLTLRADSVLDLDHETSASGSMAIRYSGRSVLVRISHVGINATEFEKMVLSDAVRAKAADFTCVKKARARSSVA
jgi:trehalose-6-phosphate synthase